jgi:uncharacterized protein (DUF362 family)
MPQKNPKVSIVRVHEQDTHAALERAVRLIDGIEEVVSPGTSVVIKPNFTMGPTEFGITNPVVIEAVLRLVSARGPRSIVVGEGSGASYTSSAFRAYNIYDMATRYGARVMDLNVDEGVRKQVPAETGREYVVLPRTVAEADVLISVPTYKLWVESPLSLSLKNLFGLYGGRYYGYNKDSRESAALYPGHYLQDEIASELGIHQPTVEHSIAAVNLARPSDLTVIDALEGSDGRGNFVRLDLLMVGKNALATDCVAMAVGGFDPEAQELVQFCSKMGLGPSSLEDIDVRGERINEVSFPLLRLQENIVELPIRYCLDRLGGDELHIIGDSLKSNGFLDEGADLGSNHEEAVSILQRVMAEGSYVEKAVASLPSQGKDLLSLIVSHGGTSGELYDLKNRYVRVHQDSDHFWASVRAVTRLGLAFLFHGQHKYYFVLAEGVSAAL